MRGWPGQHGGPVGRITDFLLPGLYQMVNGWCADQFAGIFGLERAGVEDKRLILSPAQPAMRANQLLEGSNLAGLRIVQAVDNNVAAIGVANQGFYVLWGMISEILQRVITLHAIAVQEIDAALADDNRAALFSPHRNKTDTWMRAQPFGELGEGGIDLFQGQALAVIYKVNVRQIAGHAHHCLWAIW